MSTGTIYVLRCPKTGEVRYVGQTVKALDHRLRAHLSEAKSGSRYPVHAWIRSLEFPPEIEAIESNCPETDLSSREEDLLEAMRTSGRRLLNVARPSRTLPTFMRKPKRTKFQMSRDAAAKRVTVVSF